MVEKYNPRLHALILEVVDNQLSANDPPATKATLDRLMKAGHSERRRRRSAQS